MDGPTRGRLERGWGERCITSIADGPKWTARSSGEGLEWEMGGVGGVKIGDRRAFFVMCFRRSVQLRGRALVGKGLRLPSCCRAVKMRMTSCCRKRIYRPLLQPGDSHRGGLCANDHSVLYATAQLTEGRSARDQPSSRQQKKSHRGGLFRSLLAQAISAQKVLQGTVAFRYFRCLQLSVQGPQPLT